MSHVLSQNKELSGSNGNVSGDLKLEFKSGKPGTKKRNETDKHLCQVLRRQLSSLDSSSSIDKGSSIGSISLSSEGESMCQDELMDKISLKVKECKRILNKTKKRCIKVLVANDDIMTLIYLQTNLMNKDYISKVDQASNG